MMTDNKKQNPRKKKEKDELGKALDKLKKKVREVEALAIK